jgi:hypothetical protein
MTVRRNDLHPGPVWVFRHEVVIRLPVDCGTDREV